jgi:nucleotide-binding universal stress UspA family protein
VKVLLATDGGIPAMQALSLLERVASPDQSAITVVTVGRSGSIDGQDVASEDLLDSTVARLEEAGFSASQRVLDGRPAASIIDEIAEGGFELTVLGAGNRSRLGRILMGSVSTKVLHASPTSILIVQRFPDQEPPVRVLFGSDGSGNADMAVHEMIDFLDPSSCEIEVLSVGEHLMASIKFPIPRVAYATSAPTPKLEEEWLASAERVATDAATRLEAAGFKSNTRARLGAPSIRLLDEMDEIKAQIVVVGSSGLGALERRTLGSVSDQMVRNAPATLVVRGR